MGPVKTEADSAANPRVMKPCFAMRRERNATEAE